MATKKTKSAGGQASGTDLKEFRKTNEAIGLRVSEGRLSLLSRKLFNVMVYHAQQMRVPGQNAPIDTKAAQGYFWIPLAEVARDAAYDSNDTEKLKHHLEELQNIRVHMEDERQWTSQRLVSAVSLVNPSGLKKKGGQLWFGFAFPPEVSTMVMSPTAYTKLSIYYQTLLRSGSSLALYEICRRYLTNPSKLTNRQDWEWWYGAITGNPITESIPEYKYFKRDMLKPAISEINIATDIQIELIEHRNGRRIVALQFKVEASAQESLKFPAPPIINSALVARIVALGIPQEHAETMLLENEEAYLEANLNVVEERVKLTGPGKIIAPAAYLKTALKQGYASGAQVAKVTMEKEIRPAAGPVRETLDQVRERYIEARAKESLGMFAEFDDAVQKEWLEKFKSTKLGKAARSAKGMASPLFRVPFSRWLAEMHFPPPTDSELLNFALQNPRA